jgi:hypothetical protein
MFKNEKLNVTLFISLIALQVLGIAALWTKFQWHYLPIMIAMYFWAGISTTLYLHRYLTHRGFEMPGWLKFFFATGSAGRAFRRPRHLGGGSPLPSPQVRYGRRHPQPDPRVPYAHMMWLVRKPHGFATLTALRR